jgi:drug/metabolite transporter (DMT)-like permease
MSGTWDIITGMSTLAFVLVIFSAALHAYWNLIAKKQARNPAVFFMGLGFAFLALAIPAVFALSAWGDLSRALPYMVATGMLHAIYYTLLFKGYATSDLSSLYPLARGVGIVGVTLISIAFFNAAIPFVGLLALFVIVFGVVILGFGASKSLILLKTNTLARLLPFWIGVSIVGYTLVDNEGVKQVSPVVYAAGLTLFTLIFLLPLRLWRDGKLQDAWRKHKKPSLIVGIGSIGTYLIILFVYQLTQLSFVVALRETSIAIGAIIGVLILRERWNVAKVVAVCCIVLGAVLLRLV